MNNNTKDFYTVVQIQVTQDLKLLRYNYNNKRVSNKNINILIII